MACVIRRTSCVAAVAALLLMADLSSPSAIGADDTLPAKLDNNVSALLHKYWDIHKVHLKATVKLSYDDGLLDDKTKVGAGLQRVVTAGYEYWANDDNQYRIISVIDPKSAPHMDVIAAYDGKQFRVLERGSKRLDTTKTEPNQLGAAVPNPLFVPIGFMSVDGPTAELYSLKRIKDAGRISAFVKLLKDAGRASDKQIEFPGGTLEDHELTCRVSFISGSSGMVDQIEDSDRKTQKLVSKTTFGDYAAFTLNNKPAQWPRKIVSQVLDEKGQVMLQSETEVQLLYFDPPIDPELFSIDFKLADVVWDDDAKTIIQQKQGLHPHQ